MEAGVTLPLASTTCARTRSGCPTCRRKRRAFSSPSRASRSRTRSVFLSVACDAGVARACKPAPDFGTIARFAILKLDATPRPFRVEERAASR
jgi:hypothetical protein